jgi:hypothetical protein
MYGIALGAPDMVDKWKAEIEFLPERASAIRIHLSALATAMDDLENAMLRRA